MPEAWRNEPVVVPQLSAQPAAFVLVVWHAIVKALSHLARQCADSQASSILRVDQVWCPMDNFCGVAVGTHEVYGPHRPLEVGKRIEQHKASHRMLSWLHVDCIAADLGELDIPGVGDY